MESRVFISLGTPAKETNSSSMYAIAAIIAFLILCYLLFALIKPEKF
jgi:K+-transporting ATPase KdpF subunit